MNKLMVALVILFGFTVSAQAQMGGGMMREQKGEVKPCCMMMNEGQQMPMMKQGMMHDMIKMMTDIVTMQQRIVNGVKPAEKKSMMMKLNEMMEKTKKMMSDMHSMPMKCMMESASDKPEEKQEKESPAKEEAPKDNLHKH